MDNLKILHKEGKVVTKKTDKLSMRFGDIIPLPINIGKVYDYIGMTFGYTNDGELREYMYNYIR